MRQGSLVSQRLLFTARRGKIKTFDQIAEGTVVKEEPRYAHQRDEHPVSFRFPLQNAEQHEINKPAGECLSDGDVQHVREHERQPVKQRMNDVQHRGNKQE